MENNNLGHELDFDGVITKDISFELLPEGEYDFTVVKYELSRTNATEKMPSCKRVTLTLDIEYEGRAIPIKHSFTLFSTYEGLIGEFFVAIGQKKKGEPLRMNWPATVGARGKCKLGRRTYNGNEYNQVKKFLEPESVGYRPGTF